MKASYDVMDARKRQSKRGQERLHAGDKEQSSKKGGAKGNGLKGKKKSRGCEG